MESYWTEVLVVKYMPVYSGRMSDREWNERRARVLGRYASRWVGVRTDESYARFWRFKDKFPKREAAGDWK
jgi:predicted phosphoadenosine phosphosulfate sulfurtransferase